MLFRSLRTVLFNHLYARKLGRKWVLRIEDTDAVRLVGSILDVRIGLQRIGRQDTFRARWKGSERHWSGLAWITTTVSGRPVVRVWTVLSDTMPLGPVRGGPHHPYFQVRPHRQGIFPFD